MESIEMGTRENQDSLDKLAAKYGANLAHEIYQAFKDAKKTETFIITALGVLQEQGMYALVLFCRAQGTREKAGADKIEQYSRTILKDELSVIDTSKDLLKEILGLASQPNFENLLLADQVIEKTLIYARYHAKALSPP
ncbi:MAG: hypothetical protein ACE5KJ_08255, partial [Candidatus Zixiibacteriota bacterium]